MDNQELKKVAAGAFVFAAMSLSLMLQRSATRNIMISDAAGTLTDRESAGSTYELEVRNDMPDDRKGRLIIPLPANVGSDDIALEDDYLKHELRIYLDSKEQGFFEGGTVFCDLDILEKATCFDQNESGRMCLKFQLKGIYANECSLTETNTIEVRFFYPEDRYGKIVVVDPEKPDGDAADNALDTALLIKEIAERTPDNDIRFYFTRLDGTDMEDSEKLALVRDTGADLMMVLKTADDDDSEDGIRAYYNDRYFLRRLTNADFSDILERNAATACGGFALGVSAYEEGNDLLSEARIPSAALRIGAPSGEMDSVLLKDTNYKKKMAEGIYNGIAQAFEVME